MPDPSRMVFVNITLSLVLFFSVLFYRYIYPKKEINLFILLLIISFLPLVSLLRGGDYESGDFNAHIYRTIVFLENLKNGQFIPSWGGDLNNTYGYPVFIFYYVFVNYIVSFLHLVGLSFINSMKIFLGSCFVFSGIFMFKWSQKEFNDKRAAFVASIFYLFAPYHLINLHFRATPGEVAGFAFIPLLLYCVRKLINTPSILFSLWIGVIFYLSYLAHSPSTVFASIILVPYSFVYLLRRDNKIKIAGHLFLAIFTGFLLSTHAWIAHIILLQYTNYHKSSHGSGILFIPYWQLFFSPWRFGFLFQGPKGEFALIIGYTQLFITGLSSIVIFLKKLTISINL